MELTATWVYNKSLIMMSICIKLEIINVLEKKMFPKIVYRYPCLMTIVDEKQNLMINDTDWILCFLKEIEKNEVLSKLYCVKSRNKDDLMILCENHLNVSILAISKYDCSTDEGGALIEKMNKRFCKDCVRSCCSKMTGFFVYKIFNL